MEMRKGELQVRQPGSGMHRGRQYPLVFRGRIYFWYSKDERKQFEEVIYNSAKRIEDSLTMQKCRKPVTILWFTDTSVSEQFGS